MYRALGTPSMLVKFPTKHLFLGRLSFYCKELLLVSCLKKEKERVLSWICHKWEAIAYSSCLDGTIIYSLIDLYMWCDHCFWVHILLLFPPVLYQYEWRGLFRKNGCYLLVSDISSFQVEVYLSICYPFTVLLLSAERFLFQRDQLQSELRLARSLIDEKDAGMHRIRSTNNQVC